MSDPIHDQELAMAVKPMVGVATVVAAAFAAALTLAGAADSTAGGTQLESCAVCPQTPHAVHSGGDTAAGHLGAAPGPAASKTY